MSAVYCSTCYALTSDRKSLCRKCGSRIPTSSRQVMIGHMIVASAIGALVTFGYGLVMYCKWDKWLVPFERYNWEREEREAWSLGVAAVVGVLVFVAATLLAFACLRKPPASGYTEGTGG